MAVEGTGAPRGLVALFVAEGDGGVVHGEDPRVGDSDAMDVAGEIVEDRGVSLAGAFAPSDPIGVPDGWGYLGEEFGVVPGECGVYLAPDAFG